jgi:hypothetical protein
MCFYNQYQFACGDYRWGVFRQHCDKEHRTGETCGMKLPMNLHRLPEKCKTCTKVGVKWGRIRKEEERIQRWKTEEGRVKATPPNPAWTIIEDLQVEIANLQQQLQRERLKWVNGGTQKTLEDIGENESKNMTQTRPDLRNSFKSFEHDQPSQMGVHQVSGIFRLRSATKTLSRKRPMRYVYDVFP